MTFDAYQRASARTINTDLGYQDQLANAGLGISDEAGEVAGVIKKMLYQGNPANPTKIAKEARSTRTSLRFGRCRMWRRSLLVLALILASCGPPPPKAPQNDKPVDITICREVYIVTCWGK